PHAPHSGNGNGAVIAIVKDLFFVARIRETARMVNVPLVFARTVEEIAARVGEGPRFVLLDLTGGFDYEAMFAAMGASRPPALARGHRRRRGEARVRAPGGRRGEALPPDRRPARGDRLRSRRVRSAREGLRPALRVPRLAENDGGARGRGTIHARGDRGGEEP